MDLIDELKLAADIAADLGEESDGALYIRAVGEIRRLEIALRIKTEEHQCCSEDLMKLRESEQEGWKEAAIAWEVCASIHETWAKKKDALYSTRHADFEKHAERARRKMPPNDEAHRKDAAGGLSGGADCSAAT